MFIAALFLVSKRRIQPIGLSNNEWINKMWCIHTMEHYLAIKMDEILIQAPTRVNLENTVLRE